MITGSISHRSGHSRVVEPASKNPRPGFVRCHYYSSDTATYIVCFSILRDILKKSVIFCRKATPRDDRQSGQGFMALRQ
ncbi:MAG TPA: hypothetical protein VFW88_07805 [Burkholderiales bacterium]|nr:hypothetical protein [Burkholderiales bacterium]